MASEDTVKYVQETMHSNSDIIVQNNLDLIDVETNKVVGNCPDGHGSIYELLFDLKVLDGWKLRGVEYVLVCLADNPRINLLDYEMLGHVVCDGTKRVHVKVVEMLDVDYPCGHVYSVNEYNDNVVVDYRKDQPGVTKWGYTGYQILPIDLLLDHRVVLPLRASVTDGISKTERHVGDVLEKFPSALYSIPDHQFKPIKQKSGRWSIETLG
jgi:hypothetical protein